MIHESLRAVQAADSRNRDFAQAAHLGNRGNDRKRPDAKPCNTCPRCRGIRRGGILGGGGRGPHPGRVLGGEGGCSRIARLRPVCDNNEQSQQCEPDVAHNSHGRQVAPKDCRFSRFHRRDYTTVETEEKQMPRSTPIRIDRGRVHSLPCAVLARVSATYGWPGSRSDPAARRTSCRSCRSHTFARADADLHCSVSLARVPVRLVPAVVAGARSEP